MAVVLLLLVTLNRMVLLSGNVGGIGRIGRASRGCAQGRILLRSI